MLIKHYVTAQTAETVKSDEFVKLSLIISEIHMEWKPLIFGVPFQKNKMHNIMIIININVQTSVCRTCRLT